MATCPAWVGCMGKELVSLPVKSTHGEGEQAVELREALATFADDLKTAAHAKGESLRKQVAEQQD